MSKNCGIDFWETIDQPILETHSILTTALKSSEKMSKHYRPKQ